jgi:hypothetical protein
LYGKVAFHCSRARSDCSGKSLSPRCAGSFRSRNKCNLITRQSPASDRDSSDCTRPPVMPSVFCSAELPPFAALFDSTPATFATSANSNRTPATNCSFSKIPAVPGQFASPDLCSLVRTSPSDVILRPDRAPLFAYLLKPFFLSVPKFRRLFYSCFLLWTTF